MKMRMFEEYKDVITLGKRDQQHRHGLLGIQVPRTCWEAVRARVACDLSLLRPQIPAEDLLDDEDKECANRLVTTANEIEEDILVELL
jgi:hypothetical protein